MACGATRRRIVRPAAIQNEKPRNLDAVARVTLLLVSLTRSFSFPNSFLAQARPVHAQMVGQLFDRHPVDAGTFRVLSNALQRGPKVLTFARLFHQVAISQALVSAASQ